MSHTRSIVECHLKPDLGHLHLAKLTTADIDDFYAHLLRAGWRDDRPLAPGTVARVHAVLHRALAQAMRWDWIWLNPASSASPPRVPTPEIRPPSPGQVAVLLDWSRRGSCALLLPETRGLDWSLSESASGAAGGDVDVEGAAIAFTRALVEGPDGPELGSTKSHRTYRVELDAETLDVLMANRSWARARARDVGVDLRADAFVFSSRPDCTKPWRPNWVTKRFIAARCAAGLPHFRLHDLRHFMATEMLAARVPIATVSQRLSHARASTTLNVYAQSVPGGDRIAAETLAAILAGGGGQR